MLSGSFLYSKNVAHKYLPRIDNNSYISLIDLWLNYYYY
jgi:hypothetical protein